MNIPFFSTKTTLLIISLLTNAALLATCASLLFMAQSFYTDYRYFRALGIGTSEASTLETADSPAGETRIVLYGDSRVQNWIPLPTMNNLIFINAGINGETTTEIRRRFDHDVLRHNPDIVVIQAGTNDLTASVTRGIQDPQLLLADMHSNMEYFITTLIASNIEVVVTSVFPNNTIPMVKRLFWFNTLQSEIEASNKVFKQLSQTAGAHWLDLTPVFFNADDKVNSQLYIDTLHINPAGYRIINPLLEDLLATLVDP